MTPGEKMANWAQFGHFHLGVYSLLWPAVYILDINGCVLSYFEGTANLHCYTSCTLTTLHCSKVSFLQCCHITEDLTWTTNTKSISKKPQQRQHFLRRLKRTSLPPPILTTFYRGTIESVLTSCITVWYGNCRAADRKTLQRTVNTAAKIIGALLPIFSLHDAPAKPIVSWRTSPIPPAVSSSSYHLYKPPLVIHSPLFALDTFTHYCVYINSTKDIIYVCLHAHALQITLHCSPASCLNVSLFAHVQYLRGICTIVYIF